LKAAELVSLAAAHGIDLTHVAGNASELHGPARKRRLSPAEIKLRKDLHIGLEVVPTAQGAGSHVYRRPTWTAAELGQAAQGVGRMPWLAACYSFAGDSTGYPELHRGLMMEALRIATAEKWPMRVIGRDGSMQFYVAELAQLVLDADAHKWIFTAAPSMYAICMRMEEEIWATTMSRRFTSLHVRYEGWLATAQGMIQRRLRHEDIREVETA